MMFSRIKWVIVKYGGVCRVLLLDVGGCLGVANEDCLWVYL